MTPPARRPARTLGAILAAATLALGGVLVAPMAAQAATLTVTSDLDDSSGGTLREVIATANSGDTIVFDPSVTTIALAGGIPLVKGITIDGGGTVTITRGTLSAFTQFGIQPDAPDQDYTFKNITIAGIPGGQGWAMYASYGGDPAVNAPRDITLSNVTMRNETSPFGPAFSAFQVGGNILIEDSVIENNTATSGDGGAVNFDSVGAGITITNSVLRGNTATGGSGGALALLNGPEVVIQDSDFFNNVSSADGGAIHVADTANPISIERTTFRANVAEGYGGGIYVDQVDLERSLIVDSSTFSADSTGQFGAALAIGTVIGEVTIVNSTLDEGSEDFAMAADLVTGELSIMYSTMTGGIYVGTNEGLAEVTSTIVVQTGGVTILVDDAVNPVGVLYSILSSSLANYMADLGGNQFGILPKLGPLQDNGGPTFTRMPLAGSPAIDRGLPGGTPPTFDQRYTGFPRVIGGRVDVGAVETAGTSGDLDATRALAATGQTLNIWIPIVGGVLLLGGAAAIAINVLRRRRQP